jgi:hypothetical protein
MLSGTRDLNRIYIVIALHFRLAKTQIGYFGTYREHLLADTMIEPKPGKATHTNSRMGWSRVSLS